jgi:hypothetical protein
MERKWNGRQYHDALTDIQEHLFALACGSDARAIRKADHKRFSESGIKFMRTAGYTHKKAWFLNELKFNQS